MVVMLSFIIGFGFWVGVKLYENSVFKAFQATVRLDVRDPNDFFTASPQLLTQLKQHHQAHGWTEIAALFEPYSHQRLVLFDQDLKFITSNHSQYFSAQLEKNLNSFFISMDFISTDGEQEIQHQKLTRPYVLMHENEQPYGYLVVLPVQSFEIKPERFSSKVTRNVAWMLFMLLVTVISAVTLFLLKVLRPVKQLRMASDQLKQGQLPQPLKSSGHGEVADLTAVFNEAIAKIKQTRHIRKQFIADMAHEFKTPLANLYGKLEGAQKNIVELDLQLVDEMVREINRLEVLVNDLQQLAVADSGELLLQKQATNIAELVENTIGSLSWKNAAQWSISVDPDLVVQLDPYRIQQVFLNLFDNAYKYSGNKPCIQVVQKTQGHQVIIKVTDQGPGVPADELPKIFNRFFRSAEQPHQAQGRGLGLAICQAIMHAHHGSIEAELTASGGLQITLQLPSS